MAFVEIYPNNKSDRKYGDDYFKWHRNYNACMEWYEDGNEIVVLLNTETNEEAVYERLGEVYCLDDRFGIYCNVDVDDEYEDHNTAIRKMLKQEALDAGFPEKLPEPKKEYDVDVSTVIYQTLRIEAKDPYEAEHIACELINNDKLVRKYLNFTTPLLKGDYERFVNEASDKGVWGGKVTKVDASDISKLMEG